MSKWEMVRDGDSDREDSGLPGPCGHSVRKCMFGGPQNPYVKTLTPKIMLFGEWTFGRRWVNESGALRTALGSFQGLGRSVLVSLVPTRTPPCPPCHPGRPVLRSLRTFC